MFWKAAKWIFGVDPLGRLADTYAKFKDSEVESERIQAEVAKKQLDHALAQQQIAKEVRLATAGFWEMRILAFFTAFPFVLHLNAVGLDTTFKLDWRIHAFPEPFATNGWKILLSFFGIGVAAIGIKAGVAALIARRRR